MDETSENSFSPIGATNSDNPGTATEVTSPYFLVRTKARIAIYDDLLSAPRIIDVDPAPILQFIEQIAITTYERAAAFGGRIPYSIIREITENFIHADFRECTVSVLDHGNTIRFSDQGPGIERKMLVREPGVSSASDEMRRYIKGVGSGFPLVNEYLKINHGSLRIDDNALEGVVVTLSLIDHGATAINQPDIDQSPSLSTNLASRGVTANVFPKTSMPELSFGYPKDNDWQASTPPITRAANAHAQERGVSSYQSNDALVNLFRDERARHALETISNIGAAGPTDIAETLDVSVATAHRLLSSLEQDGFLEKTSNRKRILSNLGLEALRRVQGLQGG